MRRAFAILVLGSILAACGGGDGGSAPDRSATPAAPAAPPPAPKPAPITVSYHSVPEYSESDCPRFLDAAAAEAALDLSDPDIRAVHDYLKKLDPAHAYGVFIRRPYDFLNWIAFTGEIVDIISLPTASHETTHMDDDVLVSCAPADRYKAFFMGTVLATQLAHGDTPNVKVIDAVIDPSLKGYFRYDPYITRAAPGNDFTILLDEFAAYTGAAQTELRMLQEGEYLSVGGDAQMGGFVTMMVFVEYYLQAVRQGQPDAWDLIRHDPGTVAAIQAIWSRGEQILREGYVYTQRGSEIVMRVDHDYFDAAYSAALLSELDAIGVTHAARADWSASYLR